MTFSTFLEHDVTRYTVKQVSALTGVAATTLRAWERRYGVVSPDRSASRYRLYDADEVDRLQMMAALVRRGTPARLAAGEVERLRRQQRDAPAFAEDDLVAAMVQSARDLDSVRLSRLLDEVFGSMPFEQAADQWLLPSLTAIGEAWAAGEVDVAGEHFASGVVMARLGAIFQTIEATGPQVLVGLPPGAHHVMGSLCFGVCLRRLGVDAIHLGADVPTESWLHAVRRVQPAAVVLSVALEELIPATHEVIESIHHEQPDLAIWTGGGHAAAMASPVATVLPHEVADAAQMVAAQVSEQATS